MKKYRDIDGPVFVDLFAGCGGLSLGLEQAGFAPIFVNELNHDAMKTYLDNRLDEYPWLKQNKEYDIKSLVNKKGRLDRLSKQLRDQFGIDEIDLVAGGPPCQGYSGIGHRRSYSVAKEQLPSNTLYEDMLRVVFKLQPKIFLFENVRGLLSARWNNDSDSNKGEIWRDVRAAFRENLPNYHIRYDLVYAKDYGVPQNRPRVLMVGVRDDVGFEPGTEGVAGGLLPDPVYGYPNIDELFGDLVDIPYPPGGKTEIYPRLPEKGTVQQYFRRDRHSGRLPRKCKEVTEQEYSKHSERIVTKFRHMLKYKGRIPPEMQTKKFAQRVLPAKWDDSGPTITATSLPDDYVHYAEPRSLTVREWARLQMFPDWYQFAGKRTTGGLRRAGNPQKGMHEREVPKYTQIGNAVPVKLAFEVGKHFRDVVLADTVMSERQYG